ncbi:hypothetical protein AQI88_37515 [Streptomyces cellostaticus]|uniref:Collagen alpha 1(II) chain n=1 Tax=Streptomyces cellostaticus TaxID=67285 RepID=A0A117PU16_9ACTN|nr:hypothetical protein [Streptomyces cellostaticus]KUM91343.1 hypothetical protein AQI88_37515 [Streptomyces cellostaticus]GHI04457.1 hypothetical protein Scel_27780 [Streptomyces cellostaticus]
MSDNWQEEPQYKRGFEQVHQQSGAANTLSVVENFFRSMPFGGRTQFDDRDLNDMIDLVEQANPEHLEMAGKAMWDARDAISDAAKDLRKYVDQVDWEGEGATYFHKYAKSLLDWAKAFEDFAHSVGTEITTAATGLASVHKSMPRERDTRPAGEQTRPWHLPKAKQVESNPDYVAAQHVEKNRQEAINQVNRLGSYYSVASGVLKAQQAPSVGEIHEMPDLGVPRYYAVRDEQRRHAYSPETSTPTAAVRRSVAEGHGTAPVVHGTETGGGVPPLKEVHEPSGHPGHDVGTEINTVGTLPPPAHTTQPGPSTPTLPTTGGAGHTPPLPTGPMAPPIAPTVGRTPGYGPGGRLPISPQGRTGPSGTARGRVPQEPEGQAGRSATGGRVQQGPMGQAARATGRTSTPAGQSAVRGSTQQAGRSPLGRSITGGTPRTANTPGGRAGVTGPTSAARNGVVGGKPVTGRTPGSASNPRVPRGMVVGAEEPVSSTQPKGALGQRGVVGAPAAKADTGTGQSALRSASNPEGVIGAPRNAAGSKLQESEAGARGAGLGRGAVGNRQSANGETDRDGGPAGKQQRGPSQKQRRDAPQKRD